MLLPKYSIRTLFFIMLGGSLFALLIAFAVRGSMWALGMAVGIGSLFFVALVHGGMFLVTVVLVDFGPGRKSPTKFAPVEEPRAPEPEAPH
jgi:hypothetical protein